MIVASGVIEELRDGAVATMGQGFTLASLTEEALTVGLEVLRARHFGGMRPPARTIQPRQAAGSDGEPRSLMLNVRQLIHHLSTLDPELPIGVIDIDRNSTSQRATRLRSRPNSLRRSIGNATRTTALLVVLSDMTVRLVWWRRCHRLRLTGSRRVGSWRGARRRRRVDLKSGVLAKTRTVATFFVWTVRMRRPLVGSWISAGASTNL